MKYFTVISISLFNLIKFFIIFIFINNFYFYLIFQIYILTTLFHTILNNAKFEI